MPRTKQPRLRIRQKLGKYRLEKRLGENAFARVFQASDTIMGSKVALKVPRARFVNERLIRTFRRELPLLASVEHPGIVTPRDASIVDGRLVLSLPLGMETLKDRLSRRISFETCLRLIDQLLATTSFVHERRQVHGSLRAQNILLFPDGAARIADLGLAKIARASCSLSDYGVKHLAPEIADGRWTAASDVFSLGVLCFRMLSGVWPEAPYDQPFHGHQKLTSRLPPSAIAWLYKATDKRVSKRYSSATQMRNAFQRIRNEVIRCSRKSSPRQSVRMVSVRQRVRRAA